MPTMNTPDQEASAHIDTLWQQFEALNEEAIADGHIDPEEQTALNRIARKISELEVQIQQKMALDAKRFETEDAEEIEDTGTSLGGGIDQEIEAPLGLKETEPQVVHHPDTDLSRTESTIDGTAQQGSIAQTEPITIPTSITGSVGRGGKNAPPDVKAVQTLLNDHGASLQVDGLSGPKTVGAISTFQTANVGFSDGRVDPGGQTWGALTGGEVKPPNTDGGRIGGDDRAIKGGPIETPAPETPDAPGTKITQPEDAQEVEKGSWPRGETSYEYKGVSLKVKADKNGKLIEGAVGLPSLFGTSKTIGKTPLAFGAGVSLFETEITLPNTPPKINVEIKVGCKATLSGGIGFAEADVFAGYAVEFELAASSDLGIKILFDIDNPEATTFTSSFPVKIHLDGGVKHGIVLQVKGEKAAHTVPVKTYKQLVIVTITSWNEADIATGPGYDQLIADLTDARQTLLDIIKDANENPDMLATGPTNPEGTYEGKPDKVKSIGGELDEMKLQMILAGLQVAEDNMHAAHHRLCVDPALISNANALVQKDEDRARDIYGAAWNHRALGKQSYDQYSSALGSTNGDIINARMAQAEAITGKLQYAISLFQQGDASW